MIYSVNGKLIYKDDTVAVIECSGVGYRCQTSLATLNALPPIGSQVKLYTYLHVREDTLSLYGFIDTNELNCFKMLISVSGVGPKVGLAVLSALSPQQVALCVTTGDTKSLTRAPGVGTKTAQRIVLELKDKIASTIEDKDISYLSDNIDFSDDNISQAISALVVLGYPQSEAAVAVSKLDSSLPVEELIKKALMALGKAGSKNVRS